MSHRRSARSRLYRLVDCVEVIKELQLIPRTRRARAVAPPFVRRKAGRPRERERGVVPQDGGIKRRRGRRPQGASRVLLARIVAARPIAIFGPQQWRVRRVVFGPQPVDGEAGERGRVRRQRIEDGNEKGIGLIASWARLVHRPTWRPEQSEDVALVGAGFDAGGDGGHRVARNKSTAAGARRSATTTSRGRRVANFGTAAGRNRKICACILHRPAAARSARARLTVASPIFMFGE